MAHFLTVAANDAVEEALADLVTRADLYRALPIQTAANAAVVGGLLALFRLIPQAVARNPEPTPTYPTGASRDTGSNPVLRGADDGLARPDARRAGRTGAGRTAARRDPPPIGEPRCGTADTGASRDRQLCCRLPILM